MAADRCSRSASLPGWVNHARRGLIFLSFDTIIGAFAIIRVAAFERGKRITASVSATKAVVTKASCSIAIYGSLFAGFSFVRHFIWRKIQELSQTTISSVKATFRVFALHFSYALCVRLQDDAKRITSVKSEILIVR